MASSDDGCEFRAKPLGRGHYIPFQIKSFTSEPTRSVSPQTLRRSRVSKKLAPEKVIPEFKAKPLPIFVKRRLSSSDIQNSDSNASIPFKDISRRKSSHVYTKPPNATSKTTTPVPFALHCDKLMSSRKQIEAERAERLRLAEYDRIRKQAALQRAKDAEIDEQLNKNMFKARPIPKYYLSRGYSSK